MFAITILIVFILVGGAAGQTVTPDTTANLYYPDTAGNFTSYLGLSLTIPNDTNVMGFQFDINYPSDTFIIDTTSVTAGSFLTTSMSGDDTYVLLINYDSYTMLPRGFVTIIGTRMQTEISEKALTNGSYVMVDNLRFKKLKTGASGDTIDINNFFFGDINGSTVPSTKIRIELKMAGTLSAMTLNSVALDSGVAATGDTQVYLSFTFSGSDTTGMSYKVSGDISDADQDSYVAFSGVSPFARYVSLTGGDTVKTVYVQLKDRFGSVSSILSDQIELKTSLGTVAGPPDTSTGETVFIQAAFLSAGETFTVLQEQNDSFTIRLKPSPASGKDTINITIDFDDSIKQSRVMIVMPDKSAYNSLSSEPEITDFNSFTTMVRLINVTDSQNNSIGSDSSKFDGIKLTWNVDPSLLSQKSNLEVFYLEDTGVTWKLARTDSSVILAAATDSYINYSSGDTISIWVKHFTIYAVFPAGGWAAPTTISNVVVYPNPYVPYDGNLTNGEKGTVAEGIRIGNLASGSNVIIYDIRGLVVDEFYHSGNTGLAVWDCRNKDNQEVATGAYIIFIKFGSEKIIKKVAIVR